MKFLSRLSPKTSSGVTSNFLGVLLGSHAYFSCLLSAPYQLVSFLGSNSPTCSLFNLWSSSLLTLQLPQVTLLFAPLLYQDKHEPSPPLLPFLWSSDLHHPLLWLSLLRCLVDTPKQALPPKLFVLNSILFLLPFQARNVRIIFGSLFSSFPHLLATKSLRFTLQYFFVFFLNWSIVDLQCCVNFCYTEKWFRYTYIYTFFFVLFSIMVYHRILNIVPYAVW